MDIILQTNDSKASLELRHIEFCNGDFFCTLFVESGDFRAEHRFDFSGESLAQFLCDLIRMDETLVGTGSLGYGSEPDVLIFQTGGRGHIQVGGLLIANRLPRQEFRFAFVTDQTCLAPFLRDVRRFLKSTPGADFN